MEEIYWEKKIRFFAIFFVWFAKFRFFFESFGGRETVWFIFIEIRIFVFDGGIVLCEWIGDSIGFLVVRRDLFFRFCLNMFVMFVF